MAYKPADDIGPGWLRSETDGHLALDLNYAREVGRKVLKQEGISAVGLSGGSDGGSVSGPQGGSPYSGDEEDVRTDEADVVPYSGSGGIQVQSNTASVPIARRRRTRVRAAEAEGWLLGRPTDQTLTGQIQIRVLDGKTFQIHAPGRIIDKIEAYHFFEQFQILLPATPMLSIRVMEQIASWWKNYALPGDVLSIDCANGQASVENTSNGNFYALGTLGSIPDSHVNT